MKSNIQAFTLIELLVVVLVIGILAAVAVPQYQKAVDKAHVVSYFNLLNTIRRAQETYYLTNGKYTSNWSDLDIGVQLNDICTTQSAHFAYGCQYGVTLDDYSFSFNGEQGFVNIYWCPDKAGQKMNYGDCWYSNADAIIRFYYATSSKPNSITCTAKSSSDRGKRLCSSLQTDK